jgi:hypothetical protein
MTTARLNSISQILGGALSATMIFGFLWMNSPGSVYLVPLFAVVTVVFLIIARKKGDAVLATLRKIGPALPAGSPIVWLLLIIFLGLALRVGIALAFPAVLVSDPVSYLDLAHKLAAGMPYAEPNGRAFWPPGLPLALAALLPLAGGATPLLYGLITFVATEIATFLLGRALAGWRVGCVAAFLLAVWPNFAFAVPPLLKESLLTALWPLAIYLYLQAQTAVSKAKIWCFAILAGAAVGYSALTQPSGLLLPGCFVLFTIMTRGWSGRTWRGIVAVGVGATIVTAPWVVRDYLVLGRLIPVGTAGGFTFFMVVQPESDGRWNPIGQERAAALSADEVERSQRGYSLGIQLVRRHPLHFISTVVRKPFYLYGKDYFSIDRTFVAGNGGSAAEYLAFCWLSSTFYLCLIILFAIYIMRDEYVREAPPSLILFWLFMIYPILAHSLFDAAERHRYGTRSLVAIVAAMAVCPPGRGEIRRAGLIEISARP